MRTRRKVLKKWNGLPNWAAADSAMVMCPPGRQLPTHTARARTLPRPQPKDRHEEIKEEFFDIGAIVYFLRKLSWVVPDFTATTYHDKLRALHDQIQSEGSFITHSSRLLIEAHKPQ
jgi:hypothetical protein